MPKFSKRSQDKLNTCHPDLIRIFSRVVEKYDCSIQEGHRTIDRQNELFRQKKSKVTGGNSKHNSYPSDAVDVAPYPIPKNWGDGDFKEKAKFYHFVGYVKAAADDLRINIRCGADWDGDNDFNDQSFDDLIHFELV